MQYIKDDILNAIEYSETIPKEHRTFVGLFLIANKLRRFDNSHNTDGLLDERNGILMRIKDAIGEVAEQIRLFDIPMSDE